MRWSRAAGAALVLSACAGLAMQAEARDASARGSGGAARAAKAGAKRRGPSAEEMLATWREDASARTARRRVFVSPDGTERRSLVSIEPRWDPATGREIDARLSLVAEGVASEQGDLRIEAPLSSGAAPARMVLAGGEAISLATRARLAHRPLRGAGFSLEPRAADATQDAARPSEVRYAGEVQGGDLVLASRPGVLETSLALAARPAALAAGADGAVFFEEEIALPAGFTVEGLRDCERAGIVPGREAGLPEAGFSRFDQHLNLVDASGALRARIEAPRVTDAAGASARAFAEARLDASRGVLVYRTGAPAAWLADPSRAFPVVFDPALSANVPVTITGDDSWTITPAASAWNAVAVSCVDTIGDDYDISDSTQTIIAEDLPPFADFLAGDGHQGAITPTNGLVISWEQTYSGAPATTPATLQHATASTVNVGSAASVAWNAADIIHVFEIPISSTGNQDIALGGVPGLQWCLLPPAASSTLQSSDDFLQSASIFDVDGATQTFDFNVTGTWGLLVWEDDGAGLSGTLTITWPGSSGGGGGSVSLTSLSPSSIAAGSGGFTLTVGGSGFTLGDAIAWDGADLTTTFVSATELSASIDAAKVASAGTHTVTVDAVGGSTSNGVSFTVTSSGGGGGGGGSTGGSGSSLLRSGGSGGGGGCALLPGDAPARDAAGALLPWAAAIALMSLARRAARS